MNSILPFLCRHSKRAAMIATLLVLASSGFAAPRDNAATDGDDGFCTMAPSELLAALDGTWSLKQGAGAALGESNRGVAGVPLPPHGAQPLGFKYDPQRGVAVLSGQDTPDQMILFPVASAQAEQAARAFARGDAAKARAASTHCNPDSLRIFVGTNSYALDRDAAQHRGGSSEAAYFCSMLGMTGIPPAPVQRACSPRTTEAAHGQMTMTLLVRFQSANAGSGMLYFQGEMEGSHFGAAAPVQLSR